MSVSSVLLTSAPVIDVSNIVTAQLTFLAELAIPCRETHVLSPGAVMRALKNYKKDFDLSEKQVCMQPACFIGNVFL